MATLYDAHGRKIRSSELDEELVDEQRGVFAAPLWDSVARRMTPERLARTMADADAGDALAALTLAEELEERDLHYRSVLFTRRAVVSQLQPEVQAVDESPEELAIAAEVRELVEAPEFAELLFDLTDAIGKSFSVVRILWETSERQWRPKGYRWTDPRFFRVDARTLRTLRIEDGTPDGRPIKPHNYIVHLPKLKSGVPLRGGLARVCSIAWMFKSYTIRDLHRFLEVYGIPARVGRYNTGTPKAERAKLWRAVKLLGTDAAAILPKGMEIDFLQAQRGNESGAFLGTAEYWDRQISKAVLGQTSSAEGSAGDYKASLHHQGVRMVIAQHDARQLMASVVRQLVRNFVAFNHGARAAYPKAYLPVPVPTDLTKYTAALAPLIDRGLRVTERQILETFGLGAPQEGDRILSARAVPAMPQGPSGDAPGGTDPIDDPDPAEAA